LPLLFISCNSRQKEHLQEENLITMNTIESNGNTADIILNNNYDDELINIDFNPIGVKIARFNDKDMIQTVNIEYFPESDVIKNINEIEPHQTVIDILDKPFEKLKVGRLSEHAQDAYGSKYKIDDVFNLFGVNISPKLINKINLIDSYKEIKIRIEKLNIFLYREYGDDYFKLSVIEYDDNSKYEPKLLIGYDKEYILELLGTPTVFSDDRNIFVYNSRNSLRQINIYFNDDNNANMVQLIAWGDA